MKTIIIALLVACSLVVGGCNQKGSTSRNAAPEVKKGVAPIADNDTEYPKTPVTVSTVTRAQVKAELAAARARGEIPTNELELDLRYQLAHKN